ncbi:MAG: type II toxin-antitoxin system HicB family antitoxin [Oscillospiraceae bacterium]|nr:type II toxin-antitoxin system HicB family antitoxin [Oscillospiraceae bacterium]
MKNTYPVILTPDTNGYTVYIPDFDIYTQGADLTEAIIMSRDAIGLMGIDMEDDGKILPTPCAVKDIKTNDGSFVSLVDVDFAEYRRKNEQKVVKKNCTIPSWLCYEAEKANINFSQVLQIALKEELHITDR